eukprot:CAMPEP_0197879556 /NCGR_PEP_ID=MMETSP1439-20131203/7613_1 /TAXON_ID=66791 /ORGANISM="Gonyaulax spinifera, Strain CCMP409" /LENGTH=306 /DNA_ID=CAMNT_0043499067 /DNA_START=62 /DNA_END=980 /DNA_ORIENTATION=+
MSRPVAAARPRARAWQRATALLFAFCLLPLLAQLRQAPGQAYLAPVPRRALLAASIIGGASALLPADRAHAFKNRLYEVPQKKSPGKQPSNLGAVPRSPGAPPDLAGCGRAPNCFSSAAASEFNSFRFAPEVEKAHQLEPWRYSSGGAAAALADLERVVSAYPPGQKGIDGGGFQIIKVDKELGYLYAQFESIKVGYIDDVELLVRSDNDGKGGEVRVRSASRQGFLDFGVNAKRLIRIATDLNALEGGRWSVPLITNERYPDYIQQNDDVGLGASAVRAARRPATPACTSSASPRKCTVELSTSR